jgi:hypothetical protein
MHRSMILEFHLNKFEKVFAEKYGVQVTFTPGAAEMIAERAAGSGKDLEQYCEDLFRGYEHGLNLLRKVSGKTSFVIDRDAVEDPAGTLERWIKETYQ